MSVLQEILEWSQGRPMWQRDALRRLVLNGELSDEDISSLTETSTSASGRFSALRAELELPRIAIFHRVNFNHKSKSIRLMDARIFLRDDIGAHKICASE